MKQLVLALYAEGTTDQLFLPSIIQRTTIQVLRQYEHQQINVLTPRAVHLEKAPATRDECILQAAREASDSNILIVHADADHPTRDRAYDERFLPGQRLVQRTSTGVCSNLVPLIPIRMTEAWMLAAEHEVLKIVLKTRLSAQELGLVHRVRQVEHIANPKQTLKQLAQRATAERSGRHRNVDIHPIYVALGQQISLERLNNVPSYQEFVKDLKDALKTLNLIS